MEEPGNGWKVLVQLTGDEPQDRTPCLQGRAHNKPQQATVGQPWRQSIFRPLESSIAIYPGTGDLGERATGAAETLPMLLDLGGKVQIFTVMGFTDHSPIEIPPQNPSRRTRVSWWVYLGQGGIKQLAGFIACG